MADYNKLMEMAKEASTNAYCKYSNFKNNFAFSL